MWSFIQIFIHVQQCIQISTRINSSMYIRTSFVCSTFHIACTQHSNIHSNRSNIQQTRHRQLENWAVNTRTTGTGFLECVLLCWTKKLVLSCLTRKWWTKCRLFNFYWRKISRKHWRSRYLRNWKSVILNCGDKSQYHEVSKYDNMKCLSRHLSVQ